MGDNRSTAKCPTNGLHMTPGTAPGLDIAEAIPTSVVQRRRIQVFRFLPGLLANHEMAQRSIPVLPKPTLGKCLPRQRN